MLDLDGFEIKCNENVIISMHIHLHVNEAHYKRSSINIIVLREKYIIYIAEMSESLSKNVTRLQTKKKR